MDCYLNDFKGFEYLFFNKQYEDKHLNNFVDIYQKLFYFLKSNLYYLLFYLNCGHLDS